MVLTGMDEKGPLRPTWQDATVDWLCDRSECSVNQRTWGVLDGLNIALKIKIVENTEEQTPKFSHKTWVSCFFLQVTKPMKLHLELRAAVLMEIGTGLPPSCPHQPASLLCVAYGTCGHLGFQVCQRDLSSKCGGQETH